MMLELKMERKHERKNFYVTLMSFHYKRMNEGYMWDDVIHKKVHIDECWVGWATIKMSMEI